MGIKSNFNKFLQKKCSSDVFVDTHISDFRFKKIAIDTTLYLFRYKAGMGDRWLSGFMSLIALFRRNHVHCVFIFDGQSPDEKKDEQKRRKDDRTKKDDLVSSYESDLMNYYSTGVVSEQLTNFLTKQNIDIKDAEDMIQKKRDQVVCINQTDFDLLKKLFCIMDIPHFSAPSEAEKFCSKLCIDGLVDAVLSNDTDCLVYAAPIVLSKLNVSTGVCCRIYNQTLLESLSVTNAQFLDLCIMCGTDYNKNIASIGSSTAYKYIQTHGTIENIRDAKSIDITSLNHVRVRELFTVFDEYDVSHVPYCGKPDFKALYSFVLENKVQMSIDSFKTCFTKDNLKFF